ncbi:MAG TPA: cation-transporting P-type ATPase [Candidatus Saccharimonadales bacterium]
MWYQKTPEATLLALKTARDGLAQFEAETRLGRYGLNTLKLRGEPWWQKATEPFKSIFVAVLLGAAVLSAIKAEFLDASIVLVIVVVNAVIFYVQQLSASRVLRALRRHDALEVQVLRDKALRSLEAEQLVPGDIVLLSEGQKVAADARLVYSNNLRANEAILTGESAPVVKHTGSLKGKKEVFEQSNMLFQGTFVVSGEATAVVVATGNDTEFGHIAELAESAHQESPAQKKIDVFISRLIAAIGGVSIMVLALALYRDIALADALKFAISLAVSAVPEGLPVAISVILIVGMHRLAKRRALVHSMAAIENIGIVTAIATDKTGTLTKNRLTVQAVWQPRKTRHITQQLFLAANRANNGVGDPLDTALLEYAHKEAITHPAGRTLSAKLPFDQKLAMSGNVWQEGEVYEVLLKGAPEHIIRRSKLTTTEHGAIEAKLHELTAEGLRVLAVARVAPLLKPIRQIADIPGKDLKFIGLVAVADILRPDAASSIVAAEAAGVSVCMITGDHVETAFAIGKQLGFVENRDQVLDCRALQAVGDKKLEELVAQTRVFARVLPEHKFRILNVLQKQHIVAMTGDGVNDVPALANAHIGIAMGSGSQIAKESADIVLLNDSFRTIVEAIRGGRVIFDNIRRMLFYLLATSLGEVLTMAGALIIGLPLPVVAVQILWINLVTDTFLVIPLGLEPAEEDVMKRPPRKKTQPILDKHLIWRLALVGVGMASVSLMVFWYFLEHHGLAYAQTITFSTLVVMQWANAFNARSEWQSLFKRLTQHNGKFYIGLIGAMILQALAVFGPVGSMLHTMPVSLADVGSAAIIGTVVVICIGEAHKWYGRRWARPGRNSKEQHDRSKKYH